MKTIKMMNTNYKFHGLASFRLLREINNSKSPWISISKEIKIGSSRPFFNIPTAICKKNRIGEGEVRIIQVRKDSKIHEFVRKIGKWGRIHLPLDIVYDLQIEHNEKIQIQILQVITQNIKSDLLRCLLNEKIMVIPRTKHLSILYKPSHTPIIIQNKIPITKELIKVFFLIHGDGHYGSKLSFSNKEKKLHEFVMTVFEAKLNIPRTWWRGRIGIHYKHGTDEAKEYWGEILEDKQFYPTISTTKFNTSKVGNLRLVLDFSIVASMFRAIFSLIKKDLNHVESLHALNGLLAAEGSADISKKGLHRITLSYHKKEKKMFVEILQKAKVYNLFKDRIKQNNHGIFILENWTNFPQFFNIFLNKQILPFDIYQKRRERALRGFIEHSFSKTMSKYLSKLGIMEQATVRKLGEELGIRDDSVLRTIRSKKYVNFTVLEGKGINRNPFKISVSREGRGLLQMMETIGLELQNEETSVC